MISSPWISSHLSIFITHMVTKTTDFYSILVWQSKLPWVICLTEIIRYVSLIFAKGSKGIQWIKSVLQMCCLDFMFYMPKKEVKCHLTYRKTGMGMIWFATISNLLLFYSLSYKLCSISSFKYLPIVSVNTFWITQCSALASNLEITSIALIFKGLLSCNFNV